MNKTLLTAVAALAASPLLAGQAALAKKLGYSAPKPDGALSCECNELQRRASGLAALARAEASALPAAQARKLEAGKSELSATVSKAEAYIRDARGRSYLQQEESCGKGNGLVDAAWREWQPFLSQNSMDTEAFAGAKVANPDIPNDGDEKKNDQGRWCRPGQWWTEDRAMWAINGREGICRQKDYEIKQILNGSEGDQGYRCFEYRLK